ncbi:MAG: insulinase family protein [Sphingobacteriaceae bacterium]|nr:insulinase family protein [Sphingobacteriaceae bacterium]
MLDRKSPPAFKTIHKIDVIQARQEKLKNGIPLFSVKAGSQEITRLEFIFKAGMFYQAKPLLASFTNSLMETGTKKYSANQLSDGIDFYGSFLEAGVGQDYANITLYTLNKYIKESLHFVEEIIKNPVFDVNELKIHTTNKKQRHIINSEKVNVLARRKFAELLFGSNHPYGVQVSLNDYDVVNRNEVVDFYTNHYCPPSCTIMASGGLNPDIKEILNDFFGDDWSNGKLVQSATSHTNTTTQQKHYIQKENAVQSAIRIGRLLFNKTHPDFYHMQVLNTILGGYFGSRLMANIREDKGYTYGIGSGIMSLVNSGYFFISTEVGADVTNDALKEIYREIAKLRNELVPQEELETVKNYILGQFLRSVDGPFALSDKFKAIWEFGLDYSYFDNYVKAIHAVTPQDLQALANKYLKEEDLIECVVGKK